MVVKDEEPCPVQLYSLFIATVVVTVFHAGAALSSQQEVKIQTPTVIISPALASVIIILLQQNSTFSQCS